MKNMISLDNANTWMTAEEAITAIESDNLWDAVVNMMDDELREDVAADVAPCTELEFLAEYLRRADDGLVIG